jgi:hypothetical protein
LAKGGACKPYGRLNVLIGDDDPLGSFVFRTTGFNSIRTLAARLQYFKAISGDRLSCLPLELRLRGKSTRQSHGTPIYYVDITLPGNSTLEEDLATARETEDKRREAGFDQAVLDQVARLGLSCGAFEDTEEDSRSVVEEFFCEPKEVGTVATSELPDVAKQTAANLSEKLAVKTQQMQERVP